MWPHLCLTVVGVGAAWFPVEARPWTAVLIAAVFLALIPWGWQQSSHRSLTWLVVFTVAVIALGLSACSGWDAARAIGGLGVFAAVFLAAWLGSRRAPSERFILLFAVGLSGLAIWGLIQATIGLEYLHPDITTLSSPVRTYAEERVAGRRAFASLPLPSHLAVVLATTLPLLVSRIRMTRVGAIWALWSLVTVAGLIATRSPVGLGLAMLACFATLVPRRQRFAVVGAAALAAALVLVVLSRPDTTRLEPVMLRIDNWRTAAWLASTSPFSGVGFASFAQASQSMPLNVGNRPAHAHSLPLEALAELGPAALIATTLLGLALVRSAFRRWRAQPAMAAAILVIPLHNLVDFSLFVTGVAIPWAVLLGWTLADRDSKPDAPTRSRSAGRTVCVLAASIGLAVTVLHATSVAVEESAALAPTTENRLDGALRALHLAPWRIEPQFLVASVALESGDGGSLRVARAELSRWRWIRPRSAALSERRARLALSTGDLSSALAELWSASRFGTSDSGSRPAFDELIEAAERTSDGSPN